MNQNWCSRIPDGVLINRLALPGTHDAAAISNDYNGHDENTDDYWNAIPGCWAQRRSITQQLNLGIRVLDLRVGWASRFNRNIAMYHGPVTTGLSLNDVLNDVRTFLTQQATEFVILIFQQQGDPTIPGDISNDLRTAVRGVFGQRLYNFDHAQVNWPKLGEMRGKVLALGRLPSDVNGFCNCRGWLVAGNNNDGVLINAGQNLRIYLQDRYSGLSNPFLSMIDDNARKFAKVKAAANAPVPGVADWRLLRINHMSYSNLRYQPWKSGIGVNRLLRNSHIKIKGALMIDDADPATVNWILLHNQPLVTLQRTLQAAQNAPQVPARSGPGRRTGGGNWEV